MSDTSNPSPGDAVRAVIDQTIDALPVTPGTTPEQRHLQREAARLVIADLHPDNAIEAAVAGQIVLMFHVAAWCMQCAGAPGLPEALILRLVAQAGVATRLRMRLTAEYEKRQAGTVSIRRTQARLEQRATAEAALLEEFNPMPSEPEATPTPGPQVPPDAAALPPITPAQMWDKIRRQRAAAGLTNGFRQPPRQPRAA